MNNFDFDDDLPFSPAYENDVDNKEKENNKNESKVDSTDIENFFSGVKEKTKKDEAKEEQSNLNIENNIVDDYQNSNLFIENPLSESDINIQGLSSDEKAKEESKVNLENNSVDSYKNIDIFTNNEINTSESNDNLKKEELFNSEDENIKSKDLFKPDVIE